MKHRTIKDIVARMRAAEQYTIFVLGDSITEGARASDAAHTYTAVFTKGLAERFPDRRVIRYDGLRHPVKEAELLPLLGYSAPISVQNGEGGTLTVIRCGIGGNSVQRLLDRKDDFIGNAICPHPDLYIMMLGINDSLISNPSKYATPEVYAQNLYRLAAELTQGSPKADLIFMTPTYNDYGTDPISRLAPYVEQMRAFCAKMQIPLIDQHRLWMEHMVIGGENYGQGDWLSGVERDHCHPSDIGHAAIANEMLRCLFEEEI